MSDTLVLLLIGTLGVLVVLSVILLVAMFRRMPGAGDSLARTLLTNLQAVLGDLGTRVGQLSGDVQAVARGQDTVRTELAQTREQGQATVQQTAETLTQRIHETQQALTSVTELVHRTVRTQELLAQRLGQVQESLAGNLTAAQQSLRVEITQTRELVAQIQAADQIREKYEQEAWEALKRLETVLT
ncbi:MAG TPA: hypothetical protein VGC81_18330, partial [Candidatus Methylomirabilis sp.]